ncbi:hypothetical protein BC938DRAFT_473426 [Jimgerdemannia flammicorona]|uniref:Uncharacterized protein n=1 Tax=Jimgerdemannia flammicorona TaxID=994334 RepID=A0A433QZT6_9FUNG|nr:hypothetical protein BC938DRAFT_473426 [Jimgerdemannia flammicorona]
MRRRIDSLDAAADVELLGLVVQIEDGRVGGVVCTENELGLLDLVRAVDVLNSEDGERSVVAWVTQGDADPGAEAQLLDLLAAHVQVDGDRPDKPVGQVEMLDNAGKMCEGGRGVSLVTRFWVGVSKG